MRVSDYIMSYIADELELRDVFMLSGGGVMHLMDAITLNDHLRAVCLHHEQAVSMAVESYARYNGHFGVGLFTTGPGATHALTGLVGAWQDSVPCLFISGQSKRQEMIFHAGVEGLRQFGVQEVNIPPIVESVCKKVVSLENPEDILTVLPELVQIAKSGRPGPVWLEVPLDVQGALLDIETLEKKTYVRTPSSCSIAPLEKLLMEAKRPVVIAGRGIRLAGVEREFQDWVEQNHIPVVTTYLGVDAIEHSSLCHVGTVGIKGTRAGNLVMQNADLIIALGTSLHVSVVGYNYSEFAREAKKVVVDIDATAHRKSTIHIDCLLEADLFDVMRQLSVDYDFSDWQNWSISRKKKYPLCTEDYKQLPEKVNKYHFMEELSAQLSDGDSVVSDAGSAFYVVSQSLSLSKHRQRYITSGGLSTMGYTLPAAIGVAIASAQRVIGITGDGSLQQNIQELQSLLQYRLPVKLVVWNNQGYLSIRFTQNNYFEGRLLGTDCHSGISCPDLSKIADAYGIPYVRIASVSDVSSGVEKMLTMDGPVICEVFNPEDQLIIPTLSSYRKEDGSMGSKPLEDMYPFLSKDEFLEDMIISPLPE